MSALSTAVMSEEGRAFELALLDGRVFEAVFRHYETAIEAEPVMGFPVWAEEGWYRVAVRLMGV